MSWTIQGLKHSRGNGFIVTSNHSDGLWGPPSLLFNAYWELCTHGQSGRGLGLTTQVHFVLRLRMSSAIPPFPVYVFLVCTATTSPLLHFGGGGCCSLMRLHSTIHPQIFLKFRHLVKIMINVSLVMFILVLSSTQPIITP